jgi:F420-non-reducing hydrogenase small subunit
MPQPKTDVPEGELEIPEFYETVYTLADVVDVDYLIPGCPPVPEQTWAVLETIIQGKPLPVKGSYIGCGDKTVCEECPRTRHEKTIDKFYRIYEVEHDPELCFLEQGIFCAGPATRSGCAARCLNANMPCRGCYGAPDGVVDQGAKMLSALASVVDAREPGDVDKIINDLPDVIGYCYRFSLANSLLKRAIPPRDEENTD